MYDVIVQELVSLGSKRRFLGERKCCRYCGATGTNVFGRRTNAHALPAALGNNTLFSLDECRACNQKFSVYEDALCKAVGPFLTLGGVQGRSGVRKTGLSESKSRIRHSMLDGERKLSIAAEGEIANLLRVDEATGLLRLRMPVHGDSFVPLYAYKALMKIGLSMLPSAELPLFHSAISSLECRDAKPKDGPLLVGFSYAYVGNALPALAATVVRRRNLQDRVPYTIFLLMAGSVCFQIWLPSDDHDEHVPPISRLGLHFTAQLPKPDGGYFAVDYRDPLQFDWSDTSPRLQPFEAFELVFDPRTTNGTLIPICRE